MAKKSLKVRPANKKPKPFMLANQEKEMYLKSKKDYLSKKKNRKKFAMSTLHTSFSKGKKGFQYKAKTFHKPYKKWGSRVDKFADQKRWLKEWKRTSKYTGGLFETLQQQFKRHTKLQPGTFANVQSLQDTNFLSWNTGLTPQAEAANLDNNFSQAVSNILLQQRLQSAGAKKQGLTLYDKVFYYYTVQTPMTMYAHKAFILLEMQLNATLVRTKLVPYLFMVKDLCFYRLVQVNQETARNPHQVISLYDVVNLPVYLHNYMYYRQYRIQYYPKNIGLFFKKYWAHFTNYTNNKVWLLSNFITSDITAEAVIFEYPNIILYMGPFKRFTKLYYKNHPYAPQGQHLYLNHTHTIVKLKLFEYAAFYR